MNATWLAERPHLRALAAKMTELLEFADAMVQQGRRSGDAIDYAAFEEDLKGSLTPGKLADVVVLTQDITEVPDDRILDTRVLYTIVGGEVVYEAD